MLNLFLAAVILLASLASVSAKAIKVDYVPPPPKVAAQQGNEIVELRTKTTKTYQIGPNQYQLKASLGALHYRTSPTAPWLDIDNNWYPAVAPWNWQMTQDSYTTRALSNLTAGQVIQYSAQGETVAFQPMALQWTNALGQISQISMPQNVPLVVSGGKLLWADGYGTGRDFSWVNRPERLVTLLTLNGAPPAPPQYVIDGGNPVAELNFIFDPSQTLDIYVNGNLWDKKATVNSALAVEFRREGVTLFALAPPFAYDAAGSEVLVTSQLRKTGNSLYISVRVAYSWLQTATYPVTIDPTFDVAASLDDVYISGNTFYDTSAYFGFGLSPGSSVWKSAAGFVNVNIPNASTIDSAFLTLVCNWAQSGTTVYSNLAAEDVDDATQISNKADYEGRSLTAVVPWDSVTAWTLGDPYQSPSLVTPIKTVVDRPGWASGNAMNIFLMDDGSSAGAGRFGASWDDTTYDPPELTVTWTPPGGEAPKHYGFIF